MSNFTFLKTEWPDLHEAAGKAEALVYPDALFATLQHRAFRGELWPAVLKERPHISNMPVQVDPCSVRKTNLIF